MGEGYRFVRDGKGLVLVRGEWKAQQFFLLDLETFQERLLSNLKPGFSMRSFDVSPDGKHILFDRIRDNSDIVLIDLKRSVSSPRFPPLFSRADGSGATTSSINPTISDVPHRFYLVPLEVCQAFCA